MKSVVGRHFLPGYLSEAADRLGAMDWQAITAAFDGLDAALDVVVGLNFDALSTAQWLTLLQRCETARRLIPVPEHQLINHLARQASPEELGGKLSHAIAEWTLISRAEAGRRINVAADLGPRRGLTGEPIAPALAATAAAQRDGHIGAERTPYGDPPVLPAAARLGRSSHPRARRSPAGPPSRPVSPRTAGRAGRHLGRLPQSRRHLPR